ncbi:MAG: DUF370 domain-containing protein [Deltaproteobacteria bacterium]|nr:DUF370 domain-containing protein [Deltaproteobacteria bacterium]
MSNKELGPLRDRESSGEGACINVGHGNFVVKERIVAIVEPGSLPMRRYRESASDLNQLVDATAGRKMRSLIVTDSRHVILSALAPNTLQERLCGLMSRAQLELEEGELVS